MMELSFTKFIALIQSYEIDTEFRVSYENTLKNTIGVKWKTGGKSGGNCWNAGEDNRHYSIEGEREPNLESVDLIIEKICPEINFLIYKRLYRELLIYNEDNENEYYGNYTNYAYKYIDLEKLYNWLGENALIKIVAKPLDVKADKNIIRKNRQKKEK